MIFFRGGAAVHILTGNTTKQSDWLNLRFWRSELRPSPHYAGDGCFSKTFFN